MSLLPLLSLVAIENFEREYGVPVYIDPDLPNTAEAHGVFRRRIVVGEQFALLPYGQQMAVLLHEFGHHANWHRLIRWITLPLFWTKWAERMWHQHELEADWFTVADGYGADMAAYLSRCTGPLAADRVVRIRQLLQERIHVAHAA